MCAKALGTDNPRADHDGRHGDAEMRKPMVRLQSRRGATAVLVAVMIFLIGGMAAFAIDLARVYSGVNELQTGADATALAGALSLQRNPSSPGGTPAAASTWSANNKAFGTPLAIPAQSVVGGVWDPNARSFTPSAWAVANAVQVTAQRTTSLAFSALLGRVSPLSPQRQGTAWIANQQSLDCLKPFGMPLAYMNTLLGQPLTTAAGVERLRSLTSTLAGQQQMTVVAGPDISNPRGTPLPNTPPTTFAALTGSSSSRKDYQDAIINLQCDGSADYSVGNAESTIGQQPGNGEGDIPRTTVDAAQLTLNGNQGAGGAQTCAVQVGNDATCYDPVTNQAGVTVTIAAVTVTGSNSAALSMLLEFRLMCLFRGGNQNGSGSSTEFCPWLQSYTSPYTNYVQGTLVGYPQASTAKLGPGNTLGNTVSAAQKLVLVR